jgi:hypothetical protein
MQMQPPTAVMSAVMTLALDVLSARVLTLVALLLFAGLTSWAMYAPDYLRLVALGIFGICAFLPIIALERRQSQGEKS